MEEEDRHTQATATETQAATLRAHPCLCNQRIVGRGMGFLGKHTYRVRPVLLSKGLLGSRNRPQAIMLATRLRTLFFFE